MIPKRLLRRLSIRQLQEAIRQKKRIDRISRLERQLEHHQREAVKLQRKIEQMMGGTTAPGRPSKRRRRRLSAEARRKLSEAAKRRWAKVKGAVRSAMKPLKRRISDEGLKKIAQAARRRWAKFRAEKKGEASE